MKRRFVCQVVRALDVGASAVLARAVFSLASASAPKGPRRGADMASRQWWLGTSHANILPHCLTAGILVAVLSVLPVTADFSSSTGKHKPHIFARPVFVIPSTADSESNFLSISGENLGSPGDSSLTLTEHVAGQSHHYSIPSLDPQIISWDPARIVVQIPKKNTPTSAEVVAGQLTSLRKHFSYYEVAFFDNPDPQRGGNPPNSMTTDRLGQVWINPEFHDQLLVWNPSTRITQTLSTYPIPAVPIFTLCMGHDNCALSTNASGGESVVADTNDRVWFSESGYIATSATVQSRARILGFSIETFQPKLYNLPGNNTPVWGIAWDKRRNRVWFAQPANRIATGMFEHVTVSPAKLISFNPDGHLPDGQFDCDWSTAAQCNKIPGQLLGTCSNAVFRACGQTEDCTFADQLCPPGVADDRDCYHEYSLPASVLQPAQLVVHRDGSVWFTDYFMGNDVGRLDPTTGRVDLMPLSPPPSGIGTAWPWLIKVHPAHHDVVVSGYFSGKIAQLGKRAYSRAECKSLRSDEAGVVCERTFPLEFGMSGYMDPSCYNPCIDETLIGGVFQETGGTFTRVDSEGWFDIDRDGRIWLDRGYLFGRRKEVVFFPPMLSLIPSKRPCDRTRDAVEAFEAVNIDQNGNIWGDDYCGKRIVKYARVHRAF